MWFINTAHKWIIVHNGHDNPQDRPWMWLVRELGVGEAEGGSIHCPKLDVLIRASATCTCRVYTYLPVLFFYLTHTYLSTHTDLHLSRPGWWGLGEKRQSSVPWRQSLGSGQDSARCNPSQVMLFTFSRFQLICLNMPSSSPKKPPPLLN